MLVAKRDASNIAAPDSALTDKTAFRHAHSGYWPNSFSALRAVGRDFIIDREVGAPAGRVTARSLAALDAGQTGRLWPLDLRSVAVMRSCHPRPRDPPLG